MFWETITLAFTTIIRNKLRTFLTVLGVVIGVAAVIAMVTIGQGSSAQVSAQVASLGTSVLTVRPGSRGFGPPGGEQAPRFDLKDAEALAGLAQVGYAAPIVTSGQTVVFGSANASTQAYGTTADYIKIQNWPLAQGRMFEASEETSGAAVCVLGQTVRGKLFGTSDPLGESIRVKNVACQVIGVMAAKGAGSFGQDQDDLVLMPVKTVQRRLEGKKDVNSISVALRKSVSSADGIKAVQSVMRDRRQIGLTQADNFSVTDMKEIASMLSGT